MTNKQKVFAFHLLGILFGVCAAVIVNALQRFTLDVKLHFVVFGCAQRLLLRQQKIAGIAIFNTNDLAHMSELLNALEQYYFHVTIS